MQDAYEFLNEKLGSTKRGKNYFIVTQHTYFLHKYIYIYIYIYIYTIRIIKVFTCSYIKKCLKKCLHLFNKTFSNYQATYYKELYLLFEKSGNFFHRVSIEIGLTSPLPLFVFICPLRTSSFTF